MDAHQARARHAMGRERAFGAQALVSPCLLPLVGPWFARQCQLVGGRGIARMCCSCLSCHSVLGSFWARHHQSPHPHPPTPCYPCYRVATEWPPAPAEEEGGEEAEEE